MKKQNILIIVALVLELAAVTCVVISQLDRITACLERLCDAFQEKKSALRCRKACEADCYDDEFEDWAD